MRARIFTAMAWFAVLPALVMFAATMLSQTQNSRSQPELVSIGEISQVDPIKKWFELKSAIDGDSSPRPSTFPGEISIGIQIGGGRADTLPQPRDRIDPVTGRRLPGDDPIEDSRQRMPQERRYYTTIIYLTDKTVFKAGDKAVLLEELKISDTVQVKGVTASGARGSGIEASEVVRLVFRR